MACGGCGKRNKIHADLTKKFGDKGVLDLIERMKRARKNALVAKATGETVEIANGPAHPRAVASRGEAGCSAIQSKGD